MPTKVFKMIAVESSSIARIGYHMDPYGPNILRVEFKEGGTYEYANVPPLRVLDLLFADSHGKYFHQYIRNNPNYPHCKVEEGI